MGAWGYLRFDAVRKSYEPIRLLEWWGKHKAETARLHEEIRMQRHQKKQGAKGGGAEGGYEPPPAVSMHDELYYAEHDSEPDSTEEA